MTAPPLPDFRVRRRLAETILSALHDPGARAVLASLARDPGVVAAWLAPAEAQQCRAVLARAQRASTVLAAEPLRPASSATLAEALQTAALFFDAGLFFEAHEVLEPHWRLARKGAREVLQGLIQIAVGYQHLAAGNASGARALLGQGVARVRGRRLLGASLDSFAESVARTLEQVGTTATCEVAAPAFPRGRETSSP